MPLFKIDIEKEFSNEFWTNVYYATSVDLGAAHLVAQGILQAERQFHKDVVLFTRYRTSTVLQGDFQYITSIANLNGLVGSSSPRIPLWNVVRADMGDGGFKRPERKYYRLPLTEDEQDNGVLTNGVFTLVQQSLVNLLGDFAGEWCGPNSEPIVSVAVYPNVAMRQLRRGSRRRQTPVIP